MVCAGSNGVFSVITSRRFVTQGFAWGDNRFKALLTRALRPHLGL